LLELLNKTYISEKWTTIWSISFAA